MSSEAPRPVQPTPGPGHPPPRRGVPMIIGLVIGLVVGAGVLGAVWALSEPSGAEADAEAVCGVIARTPVPTSAKAMSQMSEEDYRRWAVAEVGPSFAEQNPDLKPLAEALQDIHPAIQQFDFEKAAAAVERAKELCGDL
ncbi:MAG: hypothetical protein ACRDSK_15140 [Actinophytocola sp.]|uniref:hypothetical protein n=1 Tax=Actinophytocola sp. TaxID=1872138 RepID=UPI003D6B821E